MKFCIFLPSLLPFALSSDGPQSTQIDKDSNDLDPNADLINAWWCNLMLDANYQAKLTDPISII